jgi:hypothetical protein
MVKMRYEVMDEFILLNKIKELIKYADLYLFKGFPKSDLGLKINVENEIYNLLNNVVRANYYSGNIRNKYQNEAVINVYLINIYLGFIKDKNLIINKRFLSIVRKLSEITKLLNGWVRSDK